MFRDTRTGRTVNLRGSAFAEALGQSNNNEGKVLYHNGVTVTVGKVYQLTEADRAFRGCAVDGGGDAN